MGASSSGIMVERELRPCILKNEHKALFHMWSVVQDVAPPSPMIGGHTGGQIQYTVGIVEYEDGTIHECYPHEIRFADGKINEYCFEQGGNNNDSDT